MPSKPCRRCGRLKPKHDCGNCRRLRTQLFEEAKAFLEKFYSNREDAAAVAYLHAALLLGYCALEAHVNNVAADFADRS